MLFFAIHFQRNGFAVRQSQCCFKGFCDTLLHVLTHFEAVYHHVYTVFGGFG